MARIEDRDKVRYSDELAASICKLIATGKSLKSICDQHDMPNISTVFKWLNEYDDFQAIYTRAREAQMEFYAEEIAEIADEAGTTNDEIQKAKLRIETRKWLMGKLKGRKYGDHVVPTTVNNYTDNRRVDLTFEEMKMLAPDQLKATKALIKSKLDNAVTATIEHESGEPDK